MLSKATKQIIEEQRWVYGLSSGQRAVLQAMLDGFSLLVRKVEGRITVGSREEMDTLVNAHTFRALKDKSMIELWKADETLAHYRITQAGRFALAQANRQLAKT